MRFIDYAGAALEVDFHRHYQLDLLDFLRGVYPVGKLYRLAEALPTASHYKSLVLQDVELYRGLEVEVTPAPLDFVEETAEVQQLRNVVDALHQVLWAVSGGGSRQPSPWPRPLTALQVLEEQRRDAAVDEMLAGLGVE